MTQSSQATHAARSNLSVRPTMSRAEGGQIPTQAAQSRQRSRSIAIS
jgi:hypothetical protein